MSFKTILAITELETARDQVDRAVAVTRALGAHLTLLAVGEVPHLPFYGYGGHGYVEIWAQECDTRKTALTSLADDLEKRLASEGISFDVRPGLAAIAREDDLIARHAIYCDLALVLRSGDTELSAVEKNAIDGALFDSGRPVLHVPKAYQGNGDARQVVIAWNAQAEAARAVSDALPLLTRAREITLLLVDPAVGDEDHGEEPGSDIALVLARHGLDVTVRTAAAAGRPVSETLLDTARELGADLIVMGAYGHSRLRQNILGGTTREMLENSPVPLLLSR